MSKVVGIDMGGTSIKIGLVEEGRLLATSKIQTQSHSLAHCLEELKKSIQELLHKSGSDLKGIGIAFPSIVDSHKMKILSRYVKYTDALDIDLIGWAKDHFGVPLVMENDARAALIGEWQYGAGRNCDNLVLLTLGTGVGSAVLLEGKLLRGKHFLAGNLGGHMTINLDGTECNCGNIGCVETEASTWVLNQKVKSIAGYTSSWHADSGAHLNFETVFNKANSKDEFAIKIRNHCLKVWGVCVINIVHAYDPDRIIIGGGIMKSKDDIIPAVKQMVKKYSWCKTDDIEIFAAEQVEYAGILGMAYLVGELKKQ